MSREANFVRLSVQREVIIRMTLKDAHELHTEKAAINFLHTVSFYGEAFVDCATCTSTLIGTSKKDSEH